MIIICNATYVHMFLFFFCFFCVCFFFFFSHIVSSYFPHNDEPGTCPISVYKKCILIIMIWAFAWRMCHLMRFVMFWLFDIPGHATVIKNDTVQIWAMTRENLSSEVCDQVRLKRACSATETSLSLEISAFASTGIKLSNSEEQRHWSDCTDAQADLCLCCSHMA